MLKRIWDQGPWGPQGPWSEAPGAHRAHSQPCSCLAPAGPGPTQLHGCVWALWAPGALDHGPYGPQGPWAHILSNIHLSYSFICLFCLFI